MDLIDYVRLLRRRWSWLVIFALIGLAVGIFVGSTSAVSYRATATLFVGNQVTPGTAGQTVAAQSGADFTLARMPSYAELITSPSVADPTLAQLKLKYGLSGFASHVSASVLAQTVLLHVTGSSSTASGAADLANAAATNLASVIENLEKPSNGGPSPVSVVVTSPAVTPSAPASPNKKLLAALGLIVGLILGLLAASLREQAVGDRLAAASHLDPRHDRHDPAVHNPAAQASTTQTVSTSASRPEYQA